MIQTKILSRINCDVTGCDNKTHYVESERHAVDFAAYKGWKSRACYNGCVRLWRCCQCVNNGKFPDGVSTVPAEWS